MNEIYCSWWGRSRASWAAWRGTRWPRSRGSSTGRTGAQPLQHKYYTSVSASFLKCYLCFLPELLFWSVTTMIRIWYVPDLEFIPPETPDHQLISKNDQIIIIFARPVFRIHDILGWIRIRGSMPLTNGSGFGSGSWIRILLSSLTFKMPPKN